MSDLDQWLWAVINGLLVTEWWLCQNMQSDCWGCKLLNFVQRQCKFYLWFELERSTAAINKKFSEPSSTQWWTHVDSADSDTMLHGAPLPNNTNNNCRAISSSWVFHWALQAKFLIPASVHEANIENPYQHVKGCCMYWYDIWVFRLPLTEDVMESGSEGVGWEGIDQNWGWSGTFSTTEKWILPSIKTQENE